MAPDDEGIDGNALAIDVVYSPSAGCVDCVTLELAAGSTVAQAVAGSGLLLRHPDLQLGELRCGVWGVLCDGSQMLRDRDRVELYRALTADPKEARRRRHARQGGPRK